MKLTQVLLLGIIISTATSSNLRTAEHEFDLAKHIPLDSVAGDKVEIQQFVDHINHIVSRANLYLRQNGDGSDLLEEVPLNASFICNGCHAVLLYLQNLKGIILSGLGRAIMIDVCRFLYSKDVCTGLIRDVGTMWVTLIFERILDPKRQCPLLGFCQREYKPWTLKDFIGDILKDKPKNATIPQPTRRKSYRIAHITDVHLDHKYKEGTTVDHQNDIIGCRIGKGDAGPWGTPSCDTPQRSVEAIADYVANDLNVDMMIWTGDNIAHDIWDQHAENQTTPTKVVSGIFAERVHKTKKLPIIPIFGNHECFPLDAYDYYSDRMVGFKDNLTSYYTPLFEDPTPLEQFKAKGYYSYKNATLNLKILAINTQACDTFNLFLIADPTDPGGMLAWLSNELKMSEDIGEGVWIIGHIPPGNNNCFLGWAKRYNVIIERYAHVVRGQFFGHTHKDHFQIQRSVVDNSIVGIVHITPSVTGYPHNYPSIRVYEIDSDTNIVLNYETYRIDSLKSKEKPIFYKAYDFLSEYGFMYMDYSVFDAVAVKMRENATLAAKVVTNFYTGTPYAIEQATKYLKQETRVASCYFQSPTYAQYWNCLGPDWTDFAYLADLVLEQLCGEWSLRPRETKEITQMIQ